NKVEERRCDLPPCTFWAHWQAWSACSVSCGDGVKRRTRICQYGTDCPGEPEERILCNEGDCNRWSAWAHWSQCDRACGGGTQYRQRECTPSNAECAGEDRQTRPCNTQVCSAQCQWTHWYAWGQCSECSACRTGIRKRLRQCVGEPGCACKGVNEEAGQCRGEVPCRVPEAVGGPQPC
ncbi:Protein T21B6.3, partial [Aphelenchoides avenae]